MKDREIVFKNFNEAAASIAHVLPADRLVIGRRPASGKDWEYYACDIEAMPTGFARIAWGTSHAADVESVVFERTVREDSSFIAITRKRFTMTMMDYDPPQTPRNIHLPDVLIVMGDASGQDMLVAVVDMLVTETSQKSPTGKRLCSEGLAAGAEALAKRLRNGSLDDGSPGSVVKSVDRFLAQLWRELSILRRG